MLCRGTRRRCQTGLHEEVFRLCVDRFDVDVSHADSAELHLIMFRWQWAFRATEFQGLWKSGDCFAVVADSSKTSQHFDRAELLPIREEMVHGGRVLSLSARHKLPGENPHGPR